MFSLGQLIIATTVAVAVVMACNDNITTIEPTTEEPTTTTEPTTTEEPTTTTAACLCKYPEGTDEDGPSPPVGSPFDNGATVRTFLTPEGAVDPCVMKIECLVDTYEQFLGYYFYNSQDRIFAQAGQKLEANEQRNFTMLEATCDTGLQKFTSGGKVVDYVGCYGIIGAAG